MTPGAIRQRRLRARRARGQIALRIVVDEARIVDAMVDAGFLNLELADNRSAIASAIERALAAFEVASVTRHDA